MPVATTEGLTVRYGSATALLDLTVEFQEGCTGLLGPNGAGKTTLLKTLLGFVAPSDGRASVMGMDVATQGLAIRQRIGLMPEQDCYIPGMNAVTFTAFAGELSGMPASQAIRRAHEVLEYCGLGEARYRPIETYSTGMKQRIKLAQALVHGPQLIFLDEPTNGLDPAGRDEMLELIRTVSHGKGVSVVVSSHLLPDIERTCDRVVVLRDGSVVTSGTVAELRATAGVQYDVQLQFASTQFLEAMSRIGASVLSSEGARVRISLEKGQPGTLLLQAARESGAQVRAFHPAVRSLEDIFLQAME